VVGVLALWLCQCLVFVLTLLLPIDPARAFLGPHASEASVARLRAEWGLDEGLGRRYARALTRVVRFDFGDSTYFRRPAVEVLAVPALLTLGRGAMAALFASGLGVALGWLSASSPTLRLGLGVLQGIPGFVLTVCVLGGAATLGMSPMTDRPTFELLTVGLSALVPAAAIGWFVSESLASDGPQARPIEFLRMLRVSEGDVKRLLLRARQSAVVALCLNAVMTTVTNVSIAEIVFSLPGFGAIFFRSCERADLSVVSAGTLTLAVLFVLARIAVSVVGRRLDLAGKGGRA
jgi:peptide/nickel transport system permease protein